MADRPKKRLWLVRHFLFKSDLTDMEWWLVEPVIPSAKRADRNGAFKTREVINSVM